MSAVTDRRKYSRSVHVSCGYMSIKLSFLDFNVQLSKDGVPIEYHDFLMNQAGIDAPLHNLILQQFRNISDAQSREENTVSKAEKNCSSTATIWGETTANNARMLWKFCERSRARTFSKRMKQTCEFKLNEAKGFDFCKGNMTRRTLRSLFCDSRKSR